MACVLCVCVAYHTKCNHASPPPLPPPPRYAVIARGDAVIYLRMPFPGSDRRESIWDHAAGAAVVEAAGGRVTDVDGKALDFSHGTTLRENVGVVATNGSVGHDKVLRAVQKVLGRIGNS